MRFEDWDVRLSNYINKDHSFDWLSHNCALFAAGGVECQTGIDFAKDYKGPKTKAGMIKRLKRVAGNVEDAVTKELGEPINVKMAKRGDVVSCETEFGLALGLCVGSKAVFLNEDGKVFFPLKICRKAWRV